MGIIWQAVGAADVQSVLEDGSSLLYGCLDVSLVVGRQDWASLKHLGIDRWSRTCLNGWPSL